MKYILFFVITVFALSKNILILNSYSVQFPWTRGEVEGILKNLKDKNLKIYIEFMDTKLFAPTPDYLNNFYKYILTIYKNIPFDVVITTDDNALNFVIKHKKDFFKNSKVFFAGVNNLSVKNIIDRREFTGVFEKKEPLANLAFLKKAVKNLKKVYVIGDKSNSAKAVIKEYKEAFKNLKGFRFIYINESNLNKVLSEIKDYKNSGMLLLTPFSFNYNSSRIDYKTAIKLISNIYKSPIVIHTDILASVPDSNIIGGRVTDALSQGESVSKKVLLYLRGEKIKNIPLTYEKANKMYLNVKNLEKFHIDIDSLGYKNAILVNRPMSFLELYKKYIITTGVILFILIVFVLILLFKNYKLRKYSDTILNTNRDIEKEIKEKFNEFSKKYSEYIQIKTDAIGNILKFMLKNLKTVVFDIKKDENCTQKGDIIENIINFCESSFEKEEEFFVKKRLKEIIEILKKTKFIKNIEINGEDFNINLDKILFTEILINLLKENTKITIKDKEIIIEYYGDMPDNIDLVKKKTENILNIDADYEKKRIILRF